MHLLDGVPVLPSVQVELAGGLGESVLDDLGGDLDHLGLVVDLAARFLEDLQTLVVGNLDTIGGQDVFCRVVYLADVVLGEQLQFDTAEFHPSGVLHVAHSIPPWHPPWMQPWTDALSRLWYVAGHIARHPDGCLFPVYFPPTDESEQAVLLFNFIEPSTLTLKYSIY